MLHAYLAAGGVLGTLARYWIGTWVGTWAGGMFPWGTFVVNGLGSFLLGLVIGAGELIPMSANLRGMLAVGFCGAFTTFSTFSLETMTLLRGGAWVRGSLYAFGSLGLGLIAIMAGFLIALVLSNPDS